MNKKNDITEQLPDSFLEIIDILGIDNAMIVIKYFGGQAIYIPKIDTIERLQRNKQIRSEFTGYNYKELARKYNLSTVQIREITNDMKMK